MDAGNRSPRDLRVDGPRRDCAISRRRFCQNRGPTDLENLCHFVLKLKNRSGSEHTFRGDFQRDPLYVLCIFSLSSRTTRVARFQCPRRGTLETSRRARNRNRVGDIDQRPGGFNLPRWLNDNELQVINHRLETYGRWSTYSFFSGNIAPPATLWKKSLLYRK